MGVQTPVADPGRYAVTQTIVASTPALARRVLVAVGQPRRSVKDLVNHTDVFSNADVLVFSVTDHDQALTARLATAYARQYTVFRRQLDTRDLADTVAQLQARIAALGRQGGASGRLYASLVAKMQDVRLLEALRQSNVYVIRTPALGDVDQIAPRPLKNTAIAAAVGLMLGIVAAFLAEALDTRIRSAEELEERLGVPLLARVPRRRAKRPEPGLAVLAEPPTSESEAFLSLRTKLALANLELQARVILVSSAHPGEGASTVAANLAAATARAGRSVLLVDLDLRDAELSLMFGSPERQGLTSVALGDAALDDVLEPVSLGAESDRAGTAVGGDRGALRLLATGPLPPRPSEFVASTAVEAILADLRSRADLVLVVAPPLLRFADAVALGPSVDALVLVSRLGTARRTNVGELRRMLSEWPAATIGFVLTGADDPSSGASGNGIRRIWSRVGSARTRQARPNVPAVEREQTPELGT
ncbi:MAG: P-loop NTPase [Actinomycetota bacterium]